MSDDAKIDVADVSRLNEILSGLNHADKYLSDLLDPAHEDHTFDPREVHQLATRLNDVRALAEDLRRKYDP